MHGQTHIRCILLFPSPQIEEGEINNCLQPLLLESEPILEPSSSQHVTSANLLSFEDVTG